MPRKTVSGSAVNLLSQKYKKRTRSSGNTASQMPLIEHGEKYRRDGKCTQVWLEFSLHIDLRRVFNFYFIYHPKTDQN